jgi:hypothetical protein
MCTVRYLSINHLPIVIICSLHLGVYNPLVVSCIFSSSRVFLKAQASGFQTWYLFAHYLDRADLPTSLDL